MYKAVYSVMSDYRFGESIPSLRFLGLFGNAVVQVMFLLHKTVVSVQVACKL